MNTSGLLKINVTSLTLTLQETRRFHSSMNIPKIENSSFKNEAKRVKYTPYETCAFSHSGNFAVDSLLIVAPIVYVLCLWSWFCNCIRKYPIFAFFDIPTGGIFTDIRCPTPDPLPPTPSG